MDKQSRDYEVCLCRRTKRGEVEDLIVEKDIKTLKELCKEGNTGNKCGGCREDLEMILNETLNKQK